jgi:dTDP-4-dehydrorhamnose 3,5-epimerase-like enzyme
MESGPAHHPADYFVKAPERAPGEMLRLPVLADQRGELIVCEGPNLPFEVRRIYWLHNIPKGVERGRHAHRRLRQLMCCVEGAVSVELFDGVSRQSYLLQHPSEALYMPPMVWRSIMGEADRSSVVVLADRPYDRSDYIFEIEEFLSEPRN